MNKNRNSSWIRHVALAVLAGCASSALAQLPPFGPYRGYVYCVEKPTLAYDIYLPAAYLLNGSPLPIIYTFSPGGGGMVTDLMWACGRLNMICVGILGSSNDVGWEVIMRECATVARDIRQRVLFDPTAEFAGGFSGGGEVSFMYSRFRAQHVAGVLSMSGWLGRGGGYPWYQTTDRVVTNLLVARTMGTLDTGRFYILAPDSNYLASCAAVIHDEFFDGGHQVPPTTVQTNCLAWLLSQRIPAGPTDRSNALAQATAWRARSAADEKESVLRECVAAMMSHPRTWITLEAQLVLDELMLDYNSFRSLPVDELAQGDFASDLFYYLARGAGDAGDWARYWSGLKALTGITGVNGDRAGDVQSLLVNYSYPAPVLQCTADTGLGQLNLWFSKDTPGLNCLVQARTDVTTNSWSDFAVPALDTSTSWSAVISLPPDSTAGYYRLCTTNAPGTSPPWPP